MLSFFRPRRKHNYYNEEKASHSSFYFSTKGLIMDEVPYFHLVNDKEGIINTVVQCAVVGAIASVAAYFIRRNGQKLVLHNVNLALRDLPCSCEPKSE